MKKGSSEGVRGLFVGFSSLSPELSGNPFDVGSAFLS